MKTYILLLFIGILPICLAAQAPESEQIPEEYFDFWVGEWNLTWEAPDGSVERGFNKIEKILDGKVLLENFKALDGRFAGYQGKSFSVFHPRSKTWKQTWVDSNGGYLDFVGKIDGDRRIFHRDGKGPNGAPVKQRMVFYDITDDSLTWDWELSKDGGKTWELQWRIHYERVK